MMDEVTALQVLGLLRDSLDRIAWEPGRQVAYFQEFHVDADELALSFHDSALMVDQLVESGALTTEAAHVVRDLNMLFEALGSSAENWNDEAVSGSSQWEAIRHLASAALLLTQPRERQVA